MKIIAELDTYAYRLHRIDGPQRAFIAAPHGSVGAVRRALRDADSEGTVQEIGDGCGARHWTRHALDHGAIIVDSRGRRLA